MKISKRKIIVGIDAGSQNIKAAMGELNNKSELHVLGVTNVPARGIKKGNIIDIENAALSINECLTSLEKLCGHEISNAIAGFSGLSINAINNHIVIAAGAIDNEISEEDKLRALQSAKNIVLPHDEMIVQMIEKQYIVDNYEGVKDPVGMSGNRLELDVLILTAAIAAMQNFYKSSERIDLHLERVIYNQLLAGEAVLSVAEKDMGAVLVDIGTNITEISIFKHGTLQNSAVIPVGADHISKDLAIILKTSIEEANKIKETYKIDLFNSVEDQNIVINDLQGKEQNQVSRKIIADIMAARVNEIAELIYSEVEKTANWATIPGGIVIIGGGAKLYGIIEFMSKVLNVPVRIGQPENIAGLNKEYIEIDHAIAIGALKYQSYCQDSLYRNVNFSLAQFFNKFNYWLRDILG